MRSEREQLKFDVFKQMCLQLARLSHDPKYQVAVMIVSRDFRDIPAIGFNGDFSGGPNTRTNMATGQSGFIHGEDNALMHLCTPMQLRDTLMMICTLKPCVDCAKRIVNGGIKFVYYIDDYDDLGPGTDEVFAAAGIHCEKI